MAKRPRWLVNAALRTVKTAFPRLARPDDMWAEAHLTEEEMTLFARLPPAERAHGIEVASRVLSAKPDAEPTLVRAALLHDIGKLGSSNNVLLRIAAHLLPQVEVPPEPRRVGLAGVRQARAHHAAYGAALVLAASGDTEVARLVRTHHEPGTDAGATLLHECDAIT